MIRYPFSKTVKPKYRFSSSSQILSFVNGGNDWMGRPCMIKHSSGKVFLAVRESTQHELGGSTINLLVSPDDTPTWGVNNAYTDAEAITGFPYSHTDPTADQTDDFILFEFPNGDLGFISHERLNTTPPNDFVTHWLMRSVNGPNVGKVWTSEGDILSKFSDIPNKKKVWAFYDYEVVGSDLYLPFAQYTTDFDTSRVSFVRSSDQGSTFTQLPDIFPIGSTASACNECAIIRVKGTTRMVALSRSRNLNVTYMRESPDLGATWGGIVDVSNWLGREGVHQPRLVYLDETNDIYLMGRIYTSSTNWKNGCYRIPDGIFPNFEVFNCEQVGTTDAGYSKFIKKANGNLYGVGYKGSLTAARIYDFHLVPNT